MTSVGRWFGRKGKKEPKDFDRHKTNSMPSSSSSVLVRLISAPWCKRCHDIKPDVVNHCTLAGATLDHVNYDDWDEEDPRRAEIKSLPTILMSVDGGKTHQVYTAATIEDWKVAIFATIQLGGGGLTDVDF
jgi:hypothetical protein